MKFYDIRHLNNYSIAKQFGKLDNVDNKIAQCLAPPPPSNFQIGIPDVPNGNITAPPPHQNQQTSITVVDESNNNNNSPPIFNSNRIFNHSNGSPLFNNSSKFFGQTPPPSNSISSSSIQLPINELSKHSIKEPVKITVKITLLDSIEVQWESLLINEILYVYISQPPTGNSKEAFIALLEFAEEELHCKTVVVYLDKQNPDRSKIGFFVFVLTL